VIKLIDILNELNTRQKELLGKGLEHTVYPSNDPNKVYKLGETKFVNEWVPIFKSHPDLFPIIYKTGIYKGDKDITWVEMERLDTEQFEVDFDVLDSIINNSILSTIKRAERDKDYFDKLVAKIRQQDDEIADFYIKLYNNVVQTKRFKSGWFDIYDFHGGQFGYDKKGNIKMLDF
jgi:hypothetical protein